jgi:hypothetical protein
MEIDKRKVLTVVGIVFLAASLVSFFTVGEWGWLTFVGLICFID